MDTLTGQSSLGLSVPKIPKSQCSREGQQTSWTDVKWIFNWESLCSGAAACLGHSYSSREWVDTTGVLFLLDPFAGHQNGDQSVCSNVFGVYSGRYFRVIYVFMCISLQKIWEVLADWERGVLQWLTMIRKCGEPTTHSQDLSFSNFRKEAVFIQATEDNNAFDEVDSSPISWFHKRFYTFCSSIVTL